MRITLLLFMMVFLGCDKPTHISSTEFEHEYKLRNQQTMHSAEYLGEIDGKVYLKKKSMPLVGTKWREEILFTEVDALDVDILKELRHHSVNQK